MLYPQSIESKLGFTDIRQMLRSLCLFLPGKELVDTMQLATDAGEINSRLAEVREYRRLEAETDRIPLQYVFDVREAVKRLRLEGTHIDEDELYDLRRSLGTIDEMVALLRREEDSGTDSDGSPLRTPLYPALHRMADGILTFPLLLKAIDDILDKFGHIRDNASPELASIRHDLAKTAGSVSRTLYNILHAAQADGLVERDVTPTMRDGRLVIPVAPALKRRMNGIVHDESATGKTVFIEPAEVVEANNRIRELEAAEKREIIRILKAISADIRPHADDILRSYAFLATVDFTRAKAQLAAQLGGIEPTVADSPHIDWIRAVHPLLRLALARQGKEAMPLDITLTADKRLLIISGPNAGGKSVCLKTVGLLQYMLQCGLSIPVGDRSRTGVFHNMMIDIGDEQSIEDELSTYSGHLTNMKNMMRHADGATLLLIDEFGGGTEPQIGGAIAEAVLLKFCEKKAFGVITTHYQNLKHFADSHPETINGAMLYDRHEMRPLFQLAIGQPGSSFAVEIARKTGMPEDVIKYASDIVGSDYIQSDKYLQDIVRDKRYWESKRQTIHTREKALEEKIARYEQELDSVSATRRDIIAQAKQQAEQLLKEANRRIENTIREIREAEAERENTKRIRKDLELFRTEVADIDTAAEDERIARKVQQIQQRRERHAERQRDKSQRRERAAEALRQAAAKREADGKPKPLAPGDCVRIKGMATIGRIEQTDGRQATVVFGTMRSKLRLDRLEHADPDSETAKPATRQPVVTLNNSTREAIDSRRLAFRPELDIRGERADEALLRLTSFVDDAILLGETQVRVLHGTGTGALRQVTRQYLASQPAVKAFHDEHVQFGGAGITVVEL